MTCKQFEVWVADLNPKFGTEAGKTRPVVVVQTNLLNGIHPSTLICPITTQVRKKASLLRVHLSVGEANLKHESDVMIDQIRAIDNKRLLNKLGEVSAANALKIQENLKIVLDVL